VPCTVCHARRAKGGKAPGERLELCTDTFG
jgi:hypothetical protein